MITQTLNVVLDGLAKEADKLRRQLRESEEEMTFGHRKFITSRRYGVFTANYVKLENNQTALKLIPAGIRANGTLGDIVREMHDMFAPEDVPEGFSYAYADQSSGNRYLVDHDNRIYLLIGENGTQ
ncbi:MAG TPA: hypothetical protein VJB90_04060 [Candidatus Nanoarchaeia archaeon]|nr:hypothetical protein [Candidatus Nanoarchaeia archaeon]